MDKNSELIGSCLKKYRKAMGLSVSQVASLMAHNYQIKVSEKTIYGWESNQCAPPAKKLIALCEIYQISDFPTSFAKKPSDGKTFVITPLERRIIQEYRHHPDMQEAVCRLLEINSSDVRELE